MLFTDHCARPSCTAGRAAFITGQLPVRTGMTTIGIPGSKQGLQKEDPTLAEVLRPLGYATGQFGKNHLGDRNEFLPTVHGFDEFYGNLYHLNAEEEPEQLDYPGVKNPAFKEKFGPRGVLHCWATDTDDPAEDPKFGRMGKQRCEDTGALTRERMKTVDGEFLQAAEQFIERSVKGDKPFFVWFNPTRMHIWTHVPQEYMQKAVDEGRPEMDVYRAGMIQHDEEIGALLKKLDDLGVADNTIVVYSTDNGYEMMLWPDGGYAPFRGEKGTTWEGGVRVPMMVRWPGKIPSGSVSNGIQSHEDLFVTLASAAGEPDIKDKLLQGAEMGGMNYKVHLDGYDQTDMLTKGGKSARNEVWYFTESTLAAARIGDYKYVFIDQPDGWFGPKVKLDWPGIYNLRLDPFEKMNLNQSLFAADWWAFEFWRFVFVQQEVAKLAKTALEFPPMQPGASFNLSVVKDKVERAMSNRAGN
jgi:arylsulfatase